VKIVITGATGFIGQNLIQTIQNKNLNVIGTYNNSKPLSKKIRYLKLDISKKNLNYYKYLKKPEVVIHLAWPNLDDFNHKNHLHKTLIEQKYFLNNLIKKGLRNLVVAGTCFEYGKKIGGIKENTKTKPILKYAIAKNNLRSFLFKLQKKYQFNLTWLRFFYIYGYNQHRKTLTNLLIDSSKKKKTLIVNNFIKRDFLSVKKIAKYIYLLSIKKKNLGLVNLCSGKSISLKSLINILIKKYKIRPIVKYKNTKLRSHESNNFYGNNSKLSLILNA
jgi:dTDP-6-deoxy-L-talose 4-dehydrogenase (NAD+)